MDLFSIIYIENLIFDIFSQSINVLSDNKITTTFFAVHQDSFLNSTCDLQ